jgi:hypothetical protein
MKERELSTRQACEAFYVSPGCLSYVPKLSSDNARIAELLLGLAQSRRNWGFGLCFESIAKRMIQFLPSAHSREIWRIEPS